MHVGLADVLIERNELDAAAQHLQTSDALGDSAGLPQHAYRWRVTMAALCCARGDLDMALGLMEEAVPLYDTDFSPPVRPVGAVRARMKLAAGDLDGARRWATDRGLGIDDELSYVDEYEHLTLARLLVATHAAGHDHGSIDDVRALLDRLLVAARAGGRTGSVIEILVLQAIAHHESNDSTAAASAMHDALVRAEPAGHIQPFLGLHADLGATAILRSAMREHATQFGRKVLAARSAEDRTQWTASSARPLLVDELSARELDVLRLLRTDLSGPDIARELIVSVNTVRTHTKNIYMKLGVNSRREAVTRATELGM